MVARSQTLQTDGELDIARADNVLDLEVRELGVEACDVFVSEMLSTSLLLEQLSLTKLLNDPGILAASKLGVILRLSASNDHLSAGENEGGCLGLTNTHDDSGESLGVCFQCE